MRQSILFEFIRSTAPSVVVSRIYFRVIPNIVGGGILYIIYYYCTGERRSLGLWFFYRDRKAHRWDFFPHSPSDTPHLLPVCIVMYTHTFLETVPLDIYPNTYTAVDAVAYRRQCGWLRVGWRTMSIRYRSPGQMKRENKCIHASAEYNIIYIIATIFHGSILSERLPNRIVHNICVKYPGRYLL